MRTGIHPARPALLWLATLILTGCGAGEGVVRVTVRSDVELFVSRLEVTATVAGAPAEVNLFQYAAPTRISSAGPRVLGLRFDAEHTGGVELAVVALDAGGNLLASGAGDGAVDASRATEVTVTL